MPTPRSAFGVALYFRSTPADEQEALEISHNELLLLRAFDLVEFDPRPPGRFLLTPRGENAFPYFLRQLRAGGAADA